MDTTTKTRCTNPTCTHAATLKLYSGPTLANVLDQLDRDQRALSPMYADYFCDLGCIGVMLQLRDNRAAWLVLEA